MLDFLYFLFFFDYIQCYSKYRLLYLFYLKLRQKAQCFIVCQLWHLFKILKQNFNISIQIKIAQMTEPQFSPYFPNLASFAKWPRDSFTEPFSTKSEPFTQWQRLPYTFITDDFCHDKRFTAKVNATTSKASIKIKETVAEKSGAHQLGDQVKVWFDLKDHGTLFAKVKSTDYIKVHFDHGLRNHHGHYLYLFGGVNSSKLLHNVSARIGVGHLTQNLHRELRLKVSFGKETQNYHFYQKIFYAYKQFRYGFLSVVDLNHKVFQKNNLLLGYHPNDNTSAYLRFEVNGFRQHNPTLSRVDTIWDSLTANVIHKIDSKSKVGLQTSFNLREKALDEAKAVYQFEYDAKKIIKASVSSKLNVALLTKNPLYGLEDIATISAGVQVSDLTSKDRSIKTGFEVSVNL